MDGITRTENLLPADKSDKGALPWNDPVSPYLRVIDKMVTASNKATKEAAQLAMKKALQKAEMEKLVAYLSGQVQNAENALAAAKGSTKPDAEASGFPDLIDAKQREVLYWKTRLQQACSPDSLGAIL
jgi:hypothetical protein